MQSLVWKPYFTDWVDDGKQMAELLEKAAAASPQGLHLRSFDATAWETKGLPLALQQLPAATLTRLAFVMRGKEPTGGEFEGMCTFSEEDQWEIEDTLFKQRLAVTNHDTETTAAALKSFTQLRSLKLTSDGIKINDKTSPLLQVLPQLTSLTKLTLDTVLHNAMTVHERLPSNLQELELIQMFSRQGSGPKPPLALGHLTALTRLYAGNFMFDVAADDVLPPNLHTLCVARLASVKPLLPLMGLRKLTINQLPAVADIAAAITAAWRVAGDSNGMGSKQGAAPPAGEATPGGAPAGGSFEERVAQLQLLLPGVAIMY